MFDDTPENLPVGDSSKVNMPDNPEPEPVTEGVEVATSSTDVPSTLVMGDATQAVDPFEGVDAPAMQTPPAAEAALEANTPARGRGKKILLVVALVVGGAIVIIVGALVALNLSSRSVKRAVDERAATPPSTETAEPVPSVTPNRDSDAATVPIVSPTPSPDALPSTPVSAQPTVPLDSDGDGLSDADEAGIGTSARKPDTDNDGLFDREEVETYRTNPLNPDSDSDGYLDGEEVSNGYDPNGSGKLFDVPRE